MTQTLDEIKYGIYIVILLLAYIGSSLEKISERKK